MTNASAITYICSNYSKLVKRYRRHCPNLEILEDCLSALSVKLLEVDYDIQNITYFVDQAFRNQLSNYRTVNQKYVQDDGAPMSLKAPCQFLEMAELQEYTSRLGLVTRNIQDLPAKQKEAVTQFLISGVVSPGLQNANTEKANYRLAIQTLRNRLGV